MFFSICLTDIFADILIKNEKLENLELESKNDKRWWKREYTLYRWWEYDILKGFDPWSLEYTLERPMQENLESIKEKLRFKNESKKWKSNVKRRLQPNRSTRNLNPSTKVTWSFLRTYKRSIDILNLLTRHLDRNSKNLIRSIGRA